jgi:MFS family permease
MDTNAQKDFKINQGRAKIWNKSFISIFIASMVINMGLTMSNSLLAKYADSLGAPPSQIGMLMSTFAISALIFKIIAAPAIDTYNKKYLSVLAAVVFATAFIGFALSKTVSLLMAFRLIQGIGMAFGTAVFLTMVSEILPKAQYSTGIGYFSLGQVIATAIGPTIGLYLVKLTGFTATYMINACVVLLSAFFVLMIRYQFKRTKKLNITFNNIIAMEALVPAAVLLFLVTGYCVVNSFLIVFSSKVGVNEGIGFFFTIYAGMMLVSRPMVGKLTDKYGLVKVFIPSLSFTVLSFIMISYSRTLPMFLLAAAISALGYGACTPAVQALAMKCVSRSRRGAASSTNYIGQDFGYLIGPAIAGAVTQTFGYVSMWRIMTIPFLIAMLIVFLSRKKIAQIEEIFSKMENKA